MKRPPIVTVMGHVDHGKTTLLDALRDTDIASGESGGITQHIGASQIEYNDNKITFIDTPGHEAFSKMRSKGGSVSDIVILVVAANDGVQPQTKEAIQHAKAADVPIIVAVNKIDLDTANPQKVKNDLLQEDIVLEELGGDVMGVEISALQKKNLDDLLESINVLSEVIEDDSSEESALEGYVIESEHDKKRGHVASIVLKSGKLSVGDEIIIGGSNYCKIRSILNYKGETVDSLIAGDPGEILGLDQVAGAGDKVEPYEGQDLQELKRKQEKEEKRKVSEKDLAVVLRADTQGTLEAISSSLEKVGDEERKVEVLLKGVGDIKESDIMLASVSDAIVLAFKVNIPNVVKEKAETNNVLVREYDVIYELIEEIEGALEGLHEIEEEKIKGRAKVLKLFPLPSGDVVAGCKVTHGKVEQGSNVSVRSSEDEVDEVFKSKVKNVKQGKEEVKRCTKGNECGLLLSGHHDDLRPGYFIEVL